MAAGGNLDIRHFPAGDDDVGPEDSAAVTISDDTWYTVRLEKTQRGILGSIDGQPATVEVNDSSDVPAGTTGLYATATSIKFDDFTVYDGASRDPVVPGFDGLAARRSRPVRCWSPAVRAGCHGQAKRGHAESRADPSCRCPRLGHTTPPSTDELGRSPTAPRGWLVTGGSGHTMAWRQHGFQGHHGGSAVAETKSRIVHGDCIAGMKKIESGTIDLVFADPPFNIGYAYDKYDDNRSYDDYLDWSRDWMAGVVRVLKPSGTFWLAIGDEYAAELKVMATRKLGLTCRNWVVWYYTFGVNCKYKFTRSHTHLFYFVRDSKDFTFNSAYPQSDDRSIRVPSARQLVYGDKRANPMGRLPDDTWMIPLTQTEPIGDREAARAGDPSRNGAAVPNRDCNGAADPTSNREAASTTDAAPRGWVLRPQDLPDGFSADSDTWYFPRVCGTFKERMGFHGCQMPEQLLARIIKACSNEGEMVLDPFAGSGTTLTVGKKLGRKPIGFEMSKDYADAVRERLRTIKPGDPIEGFEDPLYAAPKTADGTIRTASGKRAKRNGTQAPKPAEAGQEMLWADGR